MSRSLPENTTGIVAWLDGGEPSRGGGLTRKRSLVQSQCGPRHFSKSCLSQVLEMEPAACGFVPLSLVRTPHVAVLLRRCSPAGVLRGSSIELLWRSPGRAFSGEERRLYLSSRRSPNTHATAAVSAVRMPACPFSGSARAAAATKAGGEFGGAVTGELRRGGKAPGGQQEDGADRSLDLRAVAGGPDDVGGGDLEPLHSAAGRERRPAHGPYPGDGSSCGLRWHGAAAAERDGDVLGMDEDVDQRLPVGDPEVVPPRPGHGTDGGDDLPG